MLSPRSVAKQRKEHYFVKDKLHGYLCTNCGGAGQDLEVLKSLARVNGEAEAKVEPKVIMSDAVTAREMHYEELRNLEAEGLVLAQELQLEMQLLEEMELEAELQELLRLENLEREQLAAAAVASLEARQVEDEGPKRSLEDCEAPRICKVAKVAENAKAPAVPLRTPPMDPEDVASKVLLRAPEAIPGALPS